MQKPSDFVTKGLLKTTTGSADIPITGGLRYIIQPVSLDGSTDLSKSLKRWPNAQSEYRQWYRNSFGTIKAGTIKSLQVQSDTIVIAAAVLKDNQLDTKALELAMDAAGKEISENRGNVHINKFGEEWDKIEQILTSQLIKRSINVTVYQENVK